MTQVRRRRTSCWAGAALAPFRDGVLLFNGLSAAQFCATARATLTLTLS